MPATGFGAWTRFAFAHKLAAVPGNLQEAGHEQEHGHDIQDARHCATDRRERPSRDLSKTELAQCVTERLVETLTPEEHGGLAWEVQVFDDDTANAFALPGGKIGVYQGLFKHARLLYESAVLQDRVRTCGTSTFLG